MRRATTVDGAAARGGLLYTWRVTTAIRVFALALASGIVMSDDRTGASGPLLAALAVIAGASTVLDWTWVATRAAWIPMAEMLLAALMLASADASPGLYAYLVGPPVVAGVRHGTVATVNVAFIGAMGLLAAAAAATNPDPRPELVAAGPWALSGLGAGLLASWQSRSIRSQEARRAPHEAAHQLMARLHHLTSSGSLGLDAASLATDIDAAMRRATGCARAIIFVVDPGEVMRPLNGGDDVERLTQEIQIPEQERTPGAAVVPLRGAHQALGYCVLVGVPRWTLELDEAARSVADEFALRLDTAVLFDEIRHVSATEERNRIARDMHDGVAQEIVALGYVVDEIESMSREPDTRQLAALLRDEITRVVSELRYSIFDLRHQVEEQDLTAALTDYVQEVIRDTDLRVHLVLDATDSLLPGRVQSEVLRIAQEAISNVRRHARATNLWITLVAEGTALRLEVTDDGIGDASPRDRHWGLQTMQERASGIGARFDIESRSGGGTIVRLLVPTQVSTSRKKSA